MTYDYLHSSEDNLWSILYLTGYLTRMRKADLTEAEWESLGDGGSALTIPNEEIRDIFKTSIRKWFEDYALAWNRKKMFHAVWSGNTTELTEELNTLLRLTISYHDYREDFYHAFLVGIFAGAGYMVESNRKNEEGRSDIVVKDVRSGKIAVLRRSIPKILNGWNRIAGKP